MQALGKSGEGAYTRGHDISAWRPLPTNKCHMGARSIYILQSEKGGGLYVRQNYLCRKLSQKCRGAYTRGGVYLWDSTVLPTIDLSGAQNPAKKKFPPTIYPPSSTSSSHTWSEPASPWRLRPQWYTPQKPLPYANYDGGYYCNKYP
jgi:hypothetical protein